MHVYLILICVILYTWSYHWITVLHSEAKTDIVYIYLFTVMIWIIYKFYLMNTSV